jgi:hypothetical protein
MAGKLLLFCHLKYLFVLAISLFICSKISGQIDSSLVFIGENERHNFSKVSSQQADLNELVALMMLTSGETSESDIARAQKRINQSINQFKLDYRHGKYKQISRLIFKTVHNDYFTKYDEMANFSDIFKNGHYNCATATALYSVIVRELNLPNIIRERPDHVFLIIDPENTNMVMESTLPVGGVYYFDTSRYIKTLVDMKLISTEEAKNRSSEDVYDEFVKDQERTISMSQLIGDLYYNTAIFAVQNKDFEYAHQQINKAAALNTSKVIMAMKTLFTLILFEDENTDPKQRLLYADELYQQKEFAPKLTPYLLGWFEKYADQLLVVKDDLTSYQEFYILINRLFSRHELVEDKIHLRIINHRTLAEYRDLKNQKELSLAHLDTLFTLRPEDLWVQNNISVQVGHLLAHLTSSPLQLEKSCNSYIEKYPFLESSPMMNHYKMIAIKYSAIENLRNNQLGKGLKGLEQFKALIPPEGANKQMQEMLGSIYGQIGNYYVRARKDNEAKKWFLEGLQVAPESFDLQRIWRSFEEYELHYKQR